MDNHVPVINLKSAKNKKIKKLKRGEGKLMDRVIRAIERSASITGSDEGAAPKQKVIIHYTKKKKKNGTGMFSIKKPFRKKRKNSILGLKKKDVKKMGLPF